VIKTVIFDLGGVLILIDFNRSIARFKQKIKKHSDSKIIDILKNSDLVVSYHKGELSSRLFYKHIQDRFKGEFSYALFCDIWQDIFAPNEPMIRFLQKIKDEYELILLSNTNELHIDYLTKTFPFFDVFQDHIYSYKIGLLKPDPSIYKFALNRTDSRAEECMLIDDTLLNIDAALEMGMKGIHYISFEDFLKTWRALIGSL
jgi:HAD superfamily hydrolase (TIGR01509 family)